MSAKELSNKQIVERLFAIREFITQGHNDRIKAIDAVIHIDFLINSFSYEPLEIENDNFILHFKKKEIEQIRKALVNEELQEAKALVKYAHYVSKDDFPELAETVEQNNRLKLKRELLEEIVKLQHKPKELIMNKVELTENDPILKILMKYLM